jgi:hypothetical protein
MANANSSLKATRFSPYNVKQGQARARQAQDLSANGAITLIDGIVSLSKSSAGAYTLALPAAYNSTGVLIIFATTAQAHVITVAGGVNASGVSNTLTFGGAIGDSITLVADNSQWYTASKINVVIA